MFRGCCLILFLVLAGCSYDPMYQPGTWNASMSQSNDENLKVMVADPHDLIVGRSSETSLGAEAAPPIRNLFTGHRTKLPDTSTGQVFAVPSEGNQATQGASVNASQ